MQRRIDQKWRPPLALVLGGVLGVVLLLPMLGLILLRDLSPVMGWREAAVTLGFAIAGVTGLLGFLFWRLLLRPVNALVDHAERLTHGDTGANAPLTHYGTPEMQRLGQAVLDMAAALQNRHTNLRQYSDHVTHELKSPLTTLQGASEMLRHAKDPNEIAQLSELIDQSTQRMSVLLAGLRDLAAARNPLDGPDGRLDRIDLTGTPLKVSISGAGPVPVSQEALQLVFDHLAQNAVDHGAGQMTLEFDAGVLRIGDDGAGITAGNASKVFEPFFTTKRASGGTGMGLAIVSGVLEARGAEIALVPSPKGALFQIRF